MRCISLVPFSIKCIHCAKIKRGTTYYWWLEANGYPESFIKSVGECSRKNTHPKTQENPKAYASISYAERSVGTHLTDFEPQKHLDSFKRRRRSPKTGQKKSSWKHIYKVLAEHAHLRMLGRARENRNLQGSELMGMLTPPSNSMQKQTKLL